MFRFVGHTACNHTVFNEESWSFTQRFCCSLFAFSFGVEAASPTVFRNKGSKTQHEFLPTNTTSADQMLLDDNNCSNGDVFDKTRNRSRAHSNDLHESTDCANRWTTHDPFNVEMCNDSNVDPFHHARSKRQKRRGQLEQRTPTDKKACQMIL